jgi:hypothetical protein
MDNARGRLTNSASGKLIALLLGINILVTATFFALRWYYLFRVKNEFYIVSIYIFFLAAVSLLSYEIKKVKEAALLWNISHLFLSFILVAGELFFIFFSGMLPAPLLEFNPSLMYKGKEKGEMIENLDECPWVRFRPNTVIECRGYRGPDFTYKWKTDEMGFKNSPDIVRMGKVEALALGDSFVEGMGVAVENTWASILSGNGFATYNMGVQGYAPTQAAGALKKWGKNFEPKYIIFGYTPGFESRELHFLNLGQVLKNKIFTGGIESVNDFMRERRRCRYFKVTNTILDFTKERFHKSAFFGKHRFPEPAFQAYRSGIIEGQQAVFDKNSLEFKMTKGAILAVKRQADAIGAKMAVLIFAHHTTVYYEMILGAQIPQSCAELSVTNAVREFCGENEIDVIEMLPSLRNYVNDLSRTGRLGFSCLPYFKEDGHLNEIGHKLVAEEVSRYFKNKTAG